MLSVCEDLTILLALFLHGMLNTPQIGTDTAEAGCLEVKHFRPTTSAEYLESGQTPFPPTSASALP